MQEKQELIGKWRDNKLIKDERVIQAFLNISREKFVSKEFKDFAYDDHALPSLRNKTVSQPTTVAIMSQALELKLGCKVLEIGTGSGYQTALLSLLVGKKGQVHTIEIIPELVDLAKENLTSHHNVLFYEQDGSQGLQEQAPFDRIIITAAIPHIPERLIQQLNDEGILLAPVGKLKGQHMVKIKKQKGNVQVINLGDFLFTPLVGKYGFSDKEAEEIEYASNF